MAFGIIGYGAYVPRHRLDRAAIAAALGTPAGRGTRAVAGYDEDSTSMAVEAGRAALAASPGARPGRVWFATASPAYLDKTNAAAVHAALGLAPDAFAADLAGLRGGMAALRAAAEGGAPAIALLADVRGGLPGGADEQLGGDAAAAFVFDHDRPEAPVIAEVLASASATTEVLDRWRLPGEAASRTWEERFGEQAYVPLAEQVLTDLVKAAGIAPAELDHIIVTGAHTRAVRVVAGRLGAAVPGAVADDLAGVVGNPGTAAPGLLLADVLDTAEPGQLVAVLHLADGADALLLRTTDAIAGAAVRTRPSVRNLLAQGQSPMPYATFLTWRGHLHREPPRRPDPFRPQAPPAFRGSDWKFAFTASACQDCGTRHLPPARVCVGCGTADRMEAVAMADVPARVATSTVDRLASSLNPPVVVAVVDFEGGGRFQCELTDVDPASVRLGDPVEMTFRRLYTVDGVHNYFWKARPALRTGSA